MKLKKNFSRRWSCFSSEIEHFSGFGKSDSICCFPNFINDENFLDMPHTFDFLNQISRYLFFIFQVLEQNDVSNTSVEVMFNGNSQMFAHVSTIAFAADTMHGVEVLSGPRLPFRFVQLEQTENPFCVQAGVFQNRTHKTTIVINRCQIDVNANFDNDCVIERACMHVRVHVLSLSPSGQFKYCILLRASVFAEVIYILLLHFSKIATSLLLVTCP